MAVKSYAWATRLAASVDDGASLDVPTPGFLTPANYKTDEPGVVVHNRVLTPQEVNSVWAADFTEVTLTNNMGAEWAAGDTVYVTVAGKDIDPGDWQASYEALEARVTALEGKVGDHEARISALEVGTPPAQATMAASSEDNDEPHSARHGRHAKKDK